MSDSNEDIYGGKMEEEEANDEHISKKKSKKKLRLMSASGQTEQERRTLRRKQRELHQEIAIGNSGAAAAGDGEELTHLRNQNNELWNQVRYPREAVLDSENVDLIADKAARKAEKIVQVSFISFICGICTGGTILLTYIHNIIIRYPDMMQYV